MAGLLANPCCDIDSCFFIIFHAFAADKLLLPTLLRLIHYAGYIIVIFAVRHIATMIHLHIAAITP